MITAMMSLYERVSRVAVVTENHVQLKTQFHKKIMMGHK